MWKCLKRQDVMVLGPDQLDIFSCLMLVFQMTRFLLLLIWRLRPLWSRCNISRAVLLSFWSKQPKKKKKKNIKGKCIFPRKRKKIRTENDFQWRTISSFFACLGYVSLLIPKNIQFVGSLKSLSSYYEGCEVARECN